MSFNKQQVGLVFDVVYDRLKSRAEDIHRMLCSKSSFEVWCSWEAFLACKIQWPEWEVQAHPYYQCHVSYGDASETGDLALCVDYANDSGWLFGEFALLHDLTSSKGMWQKVDTDRKLERSRRKKAAADRLRPRIGETFEATVTGASQLGTWVRLVDGSAEGKVVRGYKPLRVGMRVPVKLVSTDSVHGFIDFEYSGGIDSAKEERTKRKRAAAQRLQESIGTSFVATVTGISEKATWIETREGIEGRVVRGRKGLHVGQELTVILLAADAERGFIDFAAVTT